MTVKTDHGTFECREINFADRRELHRIEISTVKPGETEVNPSEFYKIIDWIMVHAFDDPEKALSHLDDIKIDEVLVEIYNAYKEMPTKKKT